MLIRRVQLDGADSVDVRIDGGRIVEIGDALTASAQDDAIDGAGTALLPGLHDHHLHLRALAASLASVRCGPPQVTNIDQLAAVLRAADARLGAGEWLRGIGFHESVASAWVGDAPVRDALDALLPHRPLRIQHRSGRLWMLNSAALALLAPEADAPLERIDGRWSGRLYDADDWLRRRVAGAAPALDAASRHLAAHGVTGVTDTTHHNGPAELQAFAAAQARGELLQALRAMGDARLDGSGDVAGVGCGEHKFHLHEHQLPELDALTAAIQRSHAHGRGVAFHCVTRTELFFALAALRDAGALAGDRIEHAAVAPPELVDEIAALGLTVVTQPNFVAERGDDYLRDVDVDDRPWLYRLRGFIDAGVPLAGSTDAPFGAPDPWAAMQAAVTRRTPASAVLGAGESLRADTALRLFLSPLDSPGAAPRRVEVGAAADLCLLDRSLETALQDLAAVRVRATWRDGRCIWSQVVSPT